MVRIDMGVFEREFSKAIEFSPESDLKRLDDPSLTLRTLNCFDRLMQAKSTDELTDITEEEIVEIARHHVSLTKLYKQQRFLTETTFSRLSKLKSARTRRVL